MIRLNMRSCTLCFSAESQKANVWIFSTTWQISPEDRTPLKYGFIYQRGKYKQIKDKVDSRSGMKLTGITGRILIGLRKIK